MDLAKATGVRLALLGRSDPADDCGLADNLERFGAQGVKYRYYAVDVTDRAAVQVAVQRCTQELGPVTGLLHGAGLNRPLGNNRRGRKPRVRSRSVTFPNLTTPAP